MRKIIAILSFLLVATVGFARNWTPVQYEDTIRARFRAGDWEGGHALLVEADPNYGTLSAFCCLNGRYYYHYKNYDQARRYLILALRDDNANTEAIELLVRVERETEHYATAISHLNHYLEYAPYDAGLWRQKIELYRLDGNDLEANRLTERLYSIYPEDTLVRKDLIYQEQMRYYQYHRDGNTYAEEQSLRRILEIDPANKEANKALNNLLRKRYNAIFARDERNRQAEQRELDSLNVIRTANLSATLVMEGIYQKEREERMYPDPEVLEARRRRDSIEHAELMIRMFKSAAIDSSYVYLKRHEAANAVPLLDSVLALEPTHNEAIYLEYLSHEQLHQYDSADYYLRRYHPLPEEVFEMRRTRHTLTMKTHRNALNFTYQYARRSSVDAVTHDASVDYTHKWLRDGLNVNLSYAGREGAIADTIGYAAEGIGGAGFMVGAAWTHAFTGLLVPFETELQLSWASRFFPQWTASVGFTEELPLDWTTTQRLGYRRILNENDNYHLLSLTLSASKNINRFTLMPKLDVYGMYAPLVHQPSIRDIIYANASFKMSYQVMDGDRSSIFAAFGIGNAPEQVVLNSSMPVGFSRLNTYVGGGFSWVLNDNLLCGFAASWYTMGQQLADQQNVRSYIYLNANLMISF